MRRWLYKSCKYNLVTITHWHFCQVSTGLALLTISSSNPQEHKPSPLKSGALMVIMPMAPGRWLCLWHRAEQAGGVPSSICLSFAAKPLAPQKKLHRGEALSPRTAARHPSVGLAPEHCVLSCSLLSFSWCLTEIPTVVLCMAPQQLSSSRRWQWGLGHSENKNCLLWGPALNYKKIFGINRLWIQLLDLILQLFLIFFSPDARFCQEKS